MLQSQLSTSTVLLTPREERDLGELLATVEGGLTDVDAFEGRLDEELEALEAANIYAILGSSASIDTIMLQLQKAATMVEDLGETLYVFDVKLRTMREDIGAIEASNNTLEVSSRNNAALLRALDKVLGGLTLDEEDRRLLEKPPLDQEDRLSELVAAGWRLHELKQALDPSLPTCTCCTVSGMVVVQAARDELSVVVARFVSRAVEAVEATLRKEVEKVGGGQARLADRLARLTAPDHSRLRRYASTYSALLSLLRALHPAAHEQLAMTYATSLNGLIKKEIRLCVAELRKAAQLDAHLNPVAYNMARDKGGTQGRGGGPGGHARRGGSTISGGSDLDSSNESPSEMGGSNAYAPSSGRGRGGSSSLATLSRGGAAWSSTGMSTGTSLPLHDAWTTLLEVWIPVLIEELASAANLLLLNEGEEGRQSASGGDNGGEAAEVEGDLPKLRNVTAHGQAVVTAMLAGVDSEMMALANLASGSSAVLTLPMMVLTGYWLGSIPAGTAGKPLRQLLAAAHARLGGHLLGYVSAAIALVESYQVHRGKQAGVKQLHVLNFISKFGLMAHHVESLVLQLDGIGPSAKSEVAASTSEPVTYLGSRGRGACNDGGSGLGQDEAPGELEAWVLRWQARSEANALYTALVSAMFGSLESLAAGDPKHGARLLLENYTYFVESVRPLVRGGGVMEEFMLTATQRQEQALASYVMAQLEYSQLWKALAFSERLSQLLAAGVVATEVAYTPGCSKAELRSLLSAATSGIEKTLAKMWARIMKHLGAGALVINVWGRLKDQLLERYARLEEQMELCYPDVALSPQLGELEELLKTAGPSM